MLDALAAVELVAEGALLGVVHKVHAYLAVEVVVHGGGLDGVRVLVEHQRAVGVRLLGLRLGMREHLELRLVV